MIRVGRRLWWIEVLVEPRDCWVGFFWTRKPAAYGTASGQVSHEWHLYVCLVPCLPLHLVIGVPDTSTPLARAEQTPRVARPGDDVVLVLALLCGLLAVVWALSVLGP